MKLVYEDGAVKFYLGDSQYMSEIPDESINMIIGSPPYYNAREEYSTYSNYSEYLTKMSLIVRECWRVLETNGRIAINVPMGYDRDPYTAIGCDWTRILIDRFFRLRGHIIWVKGETNGSTAWGSWLSASNPTIRDTHEIIIIASKGNMKRDAKGRESTIDSQTFLSATSSVWNIQPRTHEWHPAVFPPEIPKRLMQLYTFKDDLILDPFCGSGTTIWAAEQIGRRAIGVDQKEEYLQKAIGNLFYNKVFQEFGNA